MVSSVPKQIGFMGVKGVACLQWQAFLDAAHVKPATGYFYTVLVKCSCHIAALLNENGYIVSSYQTLTPRVSL